MERFQIPYGKLQTFKEWLGLGEAELAQLDSVQHFFTARKEDFASFLYDFMVKIPEAKFIIEHQEKTGYLLQAWAHWFEALFSQHLNQEFLAYLWKVGMRHVEVNLDQRFSNLGFAKVREFCQKQISTGFPLEEAKEILYLVDKLIDFCILVETDAYLETSMRCDSEIIKGIADRIRNPLTVIGGHINRLMKKSDAKEPAYPIYEFIYSQSTKCERMLKDIKTYMEVFESEPSRKKVPLKALIEEVTGELLSRGIYGKPTIEIDIPEEASYVLGDPGHMKVLFEHLIENSLEALEEKNPFVRISSTAGDNASHSILIEIFNAGTPLREEELEKVFSPFYSTKPKGTGFGLSIARQAVRKNMGILRIEPVENAGTRVVLSLPRYREGFA